MFLVHIHFLCLWRKANTLLVSRELRFAQWDYSCFSFGRSTVHNLVAFTILPTFFVRQHHIHCSDPTVSN